MAGKRHILLAILITVSAGVATPGLALDHRTPIGSGYGANGDFGVKSDSFPSPLYDRADVYVFRPDGVTGKVPVIFFAPGYSNNDPEKYRGLIDHIVSRGYAVVFTPFQLVTGDLTLNEKRYDTIWAGMKEAVERYGDSFDLERVGYVGHSYGGGAIFAMALRGYEREKWGRKALMLFSMAPWYYFQLQIKDFVNFPAHAKMVIQIYEDDKVNDHRMGKDLFDRINLPSSEKDFMLVRSDRYGGARIDAGHGAPGSSAEEEDAIDFYAIYRTFDGLAGYAFEGDEVAKRVALGNGQAEQRFMGWWTSGQPIREMVAGDCVGITRLPFSFLFPYLGGAPKGLTSVSSASLKPTVLAPEALVSAWGTNFSPYPMASDGGPVTELNGTIVKVKDGACVERLAPLLFVSPTQVSYLVPPGSLSGSGSVSIYNADGGMAISPVTIGRIAPALFAANGAGSGPAAMSVLRVGRNASSEYENPLRFDFGSNSYVALPIELAKDGEQVFLQLFGTGLRYRSRLENVRATIGGVAVEVTYAGPQPDWPGLDQVNLLLPSASASSGPSGPFGGLVRRGLVEVRMIVDQIPVNPVQVNLR